MVAVAGAVRAVATCAPGEAASTRREQTIAGTERERRT